MTGLSKKVNFPKTYDSTPLTLFQDNVDQALKNITSNGLDAVRIITGSTPVQIKNGDQIIVINKITSSATAVRLPVSPKGTVFVVKDGKGDSSIYNITITATNALIDGAASYVINVDYQSIKFLFNGSQWNLI